MKKNNRASGILIHPTSFTGKYGCGDLGEGSRKIIDWLKKSGQKILQILPLGPTGYGDSPYQPFSAFAGTPYIINFDILIQKGYLTKEDLADYPAFDPLRVDYYGLYTNNFKILKIAFNNFIKNKIPESYDAFCKENADWLDGYSAFMAIKNVNNGASWDTWPKELRTRQALPEFIKEHSDKVEFYKFIQWEFMNQWQDFKKYATDNGIKIIGDIPIFISYDSSDVWENQELFYLDDESIPEIVAGVPPDYFSETGQLWGNPIYRWDLMKNNHYKWWKKRISHTLKLVDSIRVDHFRGFEAYWEIPQGETTAINGKWVEVPGEDFFNNLKEVYKEKLPELIIAEDLGVITDEVKKLRDQFNLPGMRVFEFANFPSDNENQTEDKINDFCEDAYLPENYIGNCVAYPGTHDNDTIKGWFDSLSDENKRNVQNYLKISSKNELNYAIIKSLMRSDADRVIFLMQDVLELESEYRMNTPGTCGTHNWSWRISEDMLNDEIAKKLYDITKNNGRI